jgi:acetolactate synthase I/II/III large subunit
MRVYDAIAEVLRREGAEYLFVYPTTALIESATRAGLRPMLCRQERVGVHIADGYARTSNGAKPTVFAMQYGPGAENAFSGIATAYSDSTPMLVLPLGHARERAQVFPLFNSTRSYADVTKSVESIAMPEHTGAVLRRAFSRLRMGRPGPVLVEIPEDVASSDFDEASLSYSPVRTTQTGPDPRDLEAAARVLVDAKRPVIVGGQGVMYAGATAELRTLAELLQAPVMTTMEGKGAFPENHALALGTGAGVMTGPVRHFLMNADTVFGVGTSFTRHGMVTTIPAGKVMIHATNDERDLNKSYVTDYPVLGDAKLILSQMVEVCRELIRGKQRDVSTAGEIKQTRERWLSEWQAKLTSDESPITPYRVLNDFMKVTDPARTIVTHDSGSPRDQIIPFYVTTEPRGYIGWGKSHALGTGLGLIIGAKAAAPDKFCVNFMGDAAFGMTGLDFETSVRLGLPVTTVVLNNSTMAIETDHLVASHEKFRTRDIGGSYAELGKALGGHSERVTDPAEVGPAFKRAQQANADGHAMLLEFITSAERAFSHRRGL